MKQFCRVAIFLGVGAWSAMAQSEQQHITIQMDEARAQLEKLLVNPKILSLEGGVMGAATKGAPYIADEVRESTQVLGDGTHIHNQTKVTVYRDGEGRVRRESPTEIEIWDPVSGTSYILDPKSMTYQKMEVHIAIRKGDGKSGVSAYVFSDGRKALADSIPGGIAPGQQQHVEDGHGPLTEEMMTNLQGTPGGEVFFRRFVMTAPNARKEAIGTRTIEGLNCEGERTTTTIEAGAIGNDRPISTVSERWYSQDLQLTVLSVKTDPRSGEERFSLSGVRRIEPDATLFQLPAGYQHAGPTKF